VNGHNFWKKVAAAKGPGYNASEFAREINVKRPTMNYWIEHNKIPPADIAVRIATNIGDDLNYLINGVDPEDESEVEKLVHACLHELNNMDRNKLKTVLPVLKSISASDTDYFCDISLKESEN
jgi:Bacteriophage CI repressor helix-turn-helix domain.